MVHSIHIHRYSMVTDMSSQSRFECIGFDAIVQAANCLGAKMKSYRKLVYGAAVHASIERSGANKAASDSTLALFGHVAFPAFQHHIPITYSSKYLLHHNSSTFGT